jgi:MYXO-CTERM domain-containing protein
LPDELPGGREVKLTEPLPMPAPGNTTLETTTPPANFPMPRSNPELGPSQVPVGGPCCKRDTKSDDGGCNLSAPASSRAGWAWLAALGLAASWRRRRSD